MDGRLKVRCMVSDESWPESDLIGVLGVEPGFFRDLDLCDLAFVDDDLDDSETDAADFIANYLEPVWRSRIF